MKKIVIFDLSENTSAEGGFKVSLIVKNAANGRLIVDEVQGRLSSMTEAIELWQVWYQLYLQWGDRSDWGRIRPPEQNDPIEKTIGIAFNTCQDAGDDLARAFNLDLQAPGFEEIRQTLIETIPRWQAHDLRKPPEITFMLRTSNLNPDRSLAIQRLPWHRWKFFNDRYPGAEIAFSTIALKTKVLKDKLKVLVIFGDDRNIDTTKDRQSVERYLKSHPSIYYQPIYKPDRQSLKIQLKQPYHCIFFVGHSRSTPDLDLPVRPGKSHTKIWINDREHFSPLDDDFKPLFTSLVNRGLQLAFFNSCDGLTLARELTELHINHSIVMKEVVSDLAAQAFIEYFLQEFVNGTPLHIALHKSRQHLHDRKDIYAPNASDIPTIVQNPYESQLVFKPNQLIVSIYRLTILVKDFYRSIPKKSIFVLLAICTSMVVIAWKILHPEPAFFSNVNISIGDKLLPRVDLLSDRNSEELIKGINYFKNGDYPDAAKKLKQYIIAQKKVAPYEVAPDVKIFLRNAQILRDTRDKSRILRIGVSVPLGKNPSVAKEILWGVGQLQEETINTDNPLLIAIANDNNDATLAAQIAEEFSKESSILAVVAHNASNASVAAQPIYKRNSLVMVSPTSFSTNLNGDYIYKMVEDMNIFAAPMSDRIAKDAVGSKYYSVYICGDKDSDDNQIYNDRVANILRSKLSLSAKEKCGFSFKDKLNTNRKNIIQNLIADKVDALLISPHVNQIKATVEFLEEIHDEPKLKNLKIYSSPTLYSLQTLKLNRSRNKLTGLIVPDPWFQTEKTASFIKKSRDLWGKESRDTWRTALAFAATKAVYTGIDRALLDNSLKICSSQDINYCLRKAINEKLKNIRIDPSGAIPAFRFKQDPPSQQGWIEYVQAEKPKPSLVKLNRNNEFEQLK
jgi:branched-chain amino acid transport system substrate-binding protein